MRLIIAKPAKLPVLHALGVQTLVLGQIVVASLALTAGQGNSISGHLYHLLLSQ